MLCTVLVGLYEYHTIDPLRRKSPTRKTRVKFTGQQESRQLYILKLVNDTRFLTEK